MEVSAVRTRGYLPVLLLVLILCACGRTDHTDKTVVVLRESPAPVTAPEILNTPEPSAAAVTAAPAESAAPAAIMEWYGWWRMDHCSGDWAHMYGYYWDCCAEIRQEGDTLRLQLWDEDLPKDVGLAGARIMEQDGVLRCRTGVFLDRDLGPDDWQITWTQDDCGALLHIEGYYEAVGKGGFRYEIFLRPWGSLWPGNEDEKPYAYEDWYLPLIEAGANMPDEIGKGT